MLKQTRPILFIYLFGFLKNKKCHPFIINGIEDHIHILTRLHPTISLAALVEDLKLAGQSFILDNKLFPGFDGWQGGYSAFTYSNHELPHLISYIENQEVHHHGIAGDEEYVSLLQTNRVAFDPQYIFD